MFVVIGLMLTGVLIGWVTMPEFTSHFFVYTY